MKHKKAIFWQIYFQLISLKESAFKKLVALQELGTENPHLTETGIEEKLEQTTKLKKKNYWFGDDVYIICTDSYF